jgi:hypothetical protein
MFPFQEDHLCYVGVFVPDVMRCLLACVPQAYLTVFLPLVNSTSNQGIELHRQRWTASWHCAGQLVWGGYAGWRRCGLQALREGQ